MNMLDAVMTIESDDSATTQDVLEAFQFLIDTGVVWSLQGWYGRTAHQLIEQGLCKGADADALC